MRIGLVCPYSFDVPGGVQNHVRDLADVLVSRGHQVRVLAPGEKSTGPSGQVELVGKAVAVPYNGSVARVAFGPRISARTTRWLREGSFDLVHLHEPLAPSVSLLALWAAEAPVVATFHTANVRSRTMAAAAAMMRPSTEKVLARIAVSEAARATLVHHLGGEPVVIPNGLFCDRFAHAHTRKEWESGGPVVAFLGRADEARKGLAPLLDAWPAVRREIPDARLLVAGRGALAPAVEGVEVLGPLDDRDRERLLRSATVYVAPQISGESFGIVLAEAMAAGTTVVASDLPAFRAVLDEGRAGRLFRAGDTRSLSAALRDVLTDAGARTAYEEHARAWVRRFDWSRVVEDVLTVYATAVQSRLAS